MSDQRYRVDRRLPACDSSQAAHEIDQGRPSPAQRFGVVEGFLQLGQESQYRE